MLILLLKLSPVFGDLNPSLGHLSDRGHAEEPRVLARNRRYADHNLLASRTTSKYTFTTTELATRPSKSSTTIRHHKKTTLTPRKPTKKLTTKMTTKLTTKPKPITHSTTRPTTESITETTTELTTPSTTESTTTPSTTESTESTTLSTTDETTKETTEKATEETTEETTPSIEGTTSSPTTELTSSETESLTASKETKFKRAPTDSAFSFTEHKATLSFLRRQIELFRKNKMTYFLISVLAVGSLLFILMLLCFVRLSDGRMQRKRRTLRHQPSRKRRSRAADIEWIPNEPKEDLIKRLAELKEENDDKGRRKPKRAHDYEKGFLRNKIETYLKTYDSTQKKLEQRKHDGSIQELKSDRSFPGPINLRKDRLRKTSRSKGRNKPNLRAKPPTRIKLFKRDLRDSEDSEWPRRVFKQIKRIKSGSGNSLTSSSMKAGMKSSLRSSLRSSPRSSVQTGSDLKSGSRAKRKSTQPDASTGFQIRKIERQRPIKKKGIELPEDSEEEALVMKQFQTVKMSVPLNDSQSTETNTNSTGFAASSSRNFRSPSNARYGPRSLDMFRVKRLRSTNQSGANQSSSGKTLKDGQLSDF